MWPKFVRCSFVGLPLLAGLLAVEVGADDSPVKAKDEAFRYVTPDAGQPFDYPPLMATGNGTPSPSSCRCCP